MRVLKPGQRFGDYELERRLGVGGMAEVWLAHPMVTGHRAARVVIKRIHAHLAHEPKLQTLFVDELRLLQRIEHPNVVRLYEGGAADDDLYMAMEFIDGLDLRSCLIAHDGPLWPAFAAAVVAQACVGLHFAHELKDLTGKPLNLVHRDISPDNLMIDGAGVVKVVDFGIARAETTEATTFAGTRKGKVRYMAPEYLAKSLQNPSTDVYSLGATLWELVTGCKPFQELNGPSIINAVIGAGLPRADTLRPSLPRALVDLIAAATGPARTRIKTARELEQRLRAFLELYPPPSPVQLGDEVLLWKRKLAGQQGRRSRAGGALGQLESTEVVVVPEVVSARSAFDDLSFERSPVQVAHQLDLTQVELRPPLDLDQDTTDRAVVPPDRAAERSVELHPDLEDLAHRVDGPPRRKKKR